MDHSNKRNGRRKAGNKKRRRRLNQRGHFAQELFYFTKSLEHIFGVITQAFIIGLGLMLVGAGLFQVFYSLG